MPMFLEPCRLIEPRLPMPAPGSVFPLPDQEQTTTALPQRFGAAFIAAGSEMRMRVLAQLLPYVGTMALLVIGNGAFARFAAASPPAVAPVTSKEAAEVDPDTIADLVRYLEQRDPQLPRRVLAQLEDVAPGTASWPDAGAESSRGTDAFSPSGMG
jgi:hypothetical protein